MAVRTRVGIALPLAAAVGNAWALGCNELEPELGAQSAAEAVAALGVGAGSGAGHDVTFDVAVLEASMGEATSAVSTTLPLRAFKCQTRIERSKAPTGPFSIEVRPQSDDGVSIQIEYHCEYNCQASQCDYFEELRLEGGRIVNAWPLTFARVPCVSSPVTAFAFDCGPHLGSEVGMWITPAGVSRSVNFRVPITFTAGIPDRPEGDQRMSCLPFVRYQEANGQQLKFIDNDRLRFAFEECSLLP